MKGYNATVFAYGPTVYLILYIILLVFFLKIKPLKNKGTGKTYTMVGNY